MADDDLDDDLDDDADLGDDEDLEEGEESGGGGKKSKKKLFIIIGIVLLLLIGGGAAAFFTGLLDPLLGSTEEAAEGGEGGGDGGDGGGNAPLPPGQVVFFDLDEMIVNLNSSGRRQNLLKIKVSLELASADDLAKIQQVMPRVIDNFQTYLRELRIDDLRGSAGVYRLREELLTRVNIAVQPAKVNSVLFKEMLVQ
ncbi:MAG: flagellar basal body-associated FliL family protein [Rhodospirillaceae bacterium]|jgi:flagellar FliL protein